MKQVQNRSIARRCALCIVVCAITAWALSFIVESRQDAQAAQKAAEQRSRSELQNHYRQLPLGGSVEQLFGRH